MLLVQCENHMLNIHTQLKTNFTHRYNVNIYPKTKRLCNQSKVICQKRENDHLRFNISLKIN